MDVQIKTLTVPITIIAVLVISIVIFLIKRLNYRGFELTIWKRMQGLMASSIDLEDKFHEIIELLGQIIKTKWASIYLLDKEGKFLVRKASKCYESVGEKTESFLEPTVDKDGFFKPLETIEVEKRHRDLKMISQGKARLLSIPLKGKDEELKGVVQIGPIFSHQRSLVRKRKRLLSSLSTPLFLAIDDSLVLDNYKKRIADYQLFGAIDLEMMRSLLDLESFLELNLGIAITGTEADGGLVIIKEGNIKVSQGVTDRFIKDFEHAESIWGTSPLNLSKEKVMDISYLKDEGVTALLSCPLCSDKQLLGVIALMNKKDTPFTSNNLRLVDVFAQRITLSLKHISFFGEMFKEYLTTLKGLVAAMDAKEPFTIGHSKRIAKFSVWIAKGLDLSESEIEGIEEAAYLHDVGMCGIADQILLKPGRFTEYEYSVVKHHAQIGACLVSPIKFPVDLAPIIRHHHERYDGWGYPDELKGEDIPIGARVLTVADVFNAKISNRSYRTGLSFSEALDSLKEASGKQFDPKVVDVFLSAIKKRRESVPKERPLEPCYEFKGCTEDICMTCPAYKSDRNCWEVEDTKCKQHGDAECAHCMIYTEWKSR
ncbi:MAG: HD domain-containing protein [bacterium]|nr:HD domain-containing protein [bacterium]